MLLLQTSNVTHLLQSIDAAGVQEPQGTAAKVTYCNSKFGGFRHGVMSLCLWRVFACIKIAVSLDGFGME